VACRFQNSPFDPPAERNLSEEIDMAKITPHLWFDKEAKEAADFYASLFPNSRVKNPTVLHNTPSGSVDVVTVEFFTQEFVLLSAGPLFKFNPSVSFLVACRTKDEVHTYWQTLSKGGTPLLELGAYPFSEAYGWTQDKYGVSWQVMAMGDRPVEQRIIPTLMFVGKVCGKAAEAIQTYMSIFHDSKLDSVLRYGRDNAPDRENTIKHAGFTLEGQKFAAMDSAREHNFSFNEAISFIVNCDTQAEVDYYWEKLSAVPSAEACGWLKDKYGLSWQVTPTAMREMLSDKDPAKVARLTAAFLKMKKFDIAALKETIR